MSEMTLRQWFADFTDETGETPTHVVLDWDGWDRLSDDDWSGWPISRGELVEWAALPASVLDREFHDGFGGKESPNLCAWSPSWVLFSDVYDGAESLCWVPRNPVAHSPIRPGGGA